MTDPDPNNVVSDLQHWYHPRNTASETVRSLLVYGYVLDPPTGDVEAAEVKASLHPTHRTYRAEKTYGVSSGKWYYEVEILSPGSVSLGWALTDAAPDAALGKIKQRGLNNIV